VSGSEQSESGNQQENNNLNWEVQECPADDSSMAAHECHMRGVDRWDAHEFPLLVNPRPPQDGESLNPDASSNHQENIVDNLVAFDPMFLESASGDEFMFTTHDVITNYLEKHL